MNTGSFAIHRKEASDPSVDRAPINHETALGKPFDDIGVARAVADVPPHREGDHVVGEDMMRKRTR